MRTSRRCPPGFLIALSFLLIPIVLTSARAQGIQTSPYSAANEVRRGLLPGGFASSNPFGMPGSSFLGPTDSNTIPISSGMFQGILPRIPNLELGYIYSFGPDVRTGRGTVDYLLPVSLGNDSVVFGEAHAEFQDFWKTAPGGANNRTDISIGGGYRRMLSSDTLVGLNGFYDTSRLFGTWYSSGGVGLEMAALTPGSGAIDLNLNYYGNIFTSEGIINAFRNKGGSYDIEAGYSQPLFNQALDLRLKFAGYQFDTGSAVYGWRGGADLTTRDGVFTVRYEHGHDQINGSYDTIGGFVNIGFDLANVLNGESPFTMPEPIFQSPRNLRRMLAQKVHRNWHQLTSVVLAGSPTDRFLPGPFSVPPAWFPSGGYDTWYAGAFLFPPVDVSYLSPTGHISVTFNYRFDTAPTGPFTIPNSRIYIVVYTPHELTAWNDFNIYEYSWPSSATGTYSADLTFSSLQAAFTTTGQPPDRIRFLIWAPGTSTCEVSSIQIRFNQ